MNAERFIYHAHNLRHQLLIAAASGVQYEESWGPDFIVEELKGAYARIKAKLSCENTNLGFDSNRWYRDEDLAKMVKPDQLLPEPTMLSKDQLEELGFRQWDGKVGDDGKTLWLIPFWLYPLFSDTLTVEAIDGDRKLIKDNPDNDHRAGCLAWGFRLNPEGT